MSQQDETFQTRAARAQSKLVEQVIDHPEVTLVDTGRDLEHPASPDRIVLRVHVRRAITRSELGLPNEIDGIPVALVVADYRE
jgi:hypothetical protein